MALSPQVGQPRTGASGHPPGPTNRSPHHRSASSERLRHDIRTTPWHQRNGHHWHRYVARAVADRFHVLVGLGTVGAVVADAPVRSCCPQCRLRYHAAWQPGQAQIAAAGGADRRSAKNAAAPINQSREALLAAWPHHSPEGGHGAGVTTVLLCPAGRLRGRRGLTGSCGPLAFVRLIVERLVAVHRLRPQAEPRPQARSAVWQDRSRHLEGRQCAAASPERPYSLGAPPPAPCRCCCLRSGHRHGAPLEPASLPRLAHGDRTDTAAGSRRELESTALRLYFGRSSDGLYLDGQGRAGLQADA
jgi:hypothetical protein